MQDQRAIQPSKYVPGFHFVTSLTILIALLASIWMFVEEVNALSVFAVFTSISLLSLFFFTRQFATKNQDRIIRAEENFRMYRLSGNVLDERLSKSQIIALRFASDKEFVGLADKAVKENLTPKEIKDTIKQWNVDDQRV